MSKKGPPGDPRILVPDIYPRRFDPARPEVALDPGPLPDDGGAVYPDEGGGFFQLFRRHPQVRPIVYRRWLNYQLISTTAAQPILNQLGAVETIVIQAPETVASPLFVGAGNVTTTTGLRLNPGKALVVSEDADRRRHELSQRQDEAIGLLAFISGGQFNPAQIDEPPVVVLNPNEWWIVSAVDRPANIFLFYPPERI